MILRRDEGVRIAFGGNGITMWIGEDMIWVTGEYGSSYWGVEDKA